MQERMTSERVNGIKSGYWSPARKEELVQRLAEYENIGTVEKCREAVEKQKANKPKKILRHRGGFEIHHCPNCDTDYEKDNRYTITDSYCQKCGKLLDSVFRHYCGNCGQAIDENLEGMG